MTRPRSKLVALLPRVVPLVWIVAAIIGGATVGAGTFFLIFASGALLLAIWLFWRSTLGLTEESPLSLEEALGMAAPTLEEERKASVLRILKDLEYERAVGKIEDADYRELSERYRAEARVLLSNVEEGLGPARRRAESLLESRLGEVGGAESRTANSEVAKSPAATARAPEVPNEPAATTEEPEVAKSPDRSTPGETHNAAADEKAALEQETDTAASGTRSKEKSGAQEEA